MKQTVLISGGTGTIGSRLTELLFNKGYNVTHLSRTPSQGPVKTYLWNIKDKRIERAAIEEADYIVHLAGAGIADKRWSERRKKEIINSRVNSADLLYEALKKNKNKVKAFIASSAIGYYGDRGEQILVEEDPPEDGFLGQVGTLWENSSLQMQDLGIRVAVFRGGFVLTSKEGFLPPIKKSLDWGLEPVFGDGNQFQTWIHIDDICRMFIYAIENENIQGIYNAVAPQPVRNKEFVHIVKQALGKFSIKAPAPRIMLRVLFGELAESLLFSAKVSPQKIINEGFVFNYTDLGEAVKAIYK